MDPNYLINFIRDTYSTNDLIPLHEPILTGNESRYVEETINSNFVSSVGHFVNEFESRVEKFTNSCKAVATVNGTAALHASLFLAGVKRDDLVITQALTFVATCNALYHIGAMPIFIDVSLKSLGLDPLAVERYLDEHAELDENGAFHRKTKQRIKAIVPMHTYGHPVQIDELITICNKWKLVLIEDAAESIGSYYKEKHTGTFGEYGVLSFNGNKVITTGGGGMILCNDKEKGERAKHVTTTSKIPHPYEFFHDEPGFNYRLPNINAALGCAQMETLEEKLTNKRILAMKYKDFFMNSEFNFVSEPDYGKSNYWLNSILSSDRKQRDEILKITNSNNIMTRPIWQLMHRLPMFANCLRDDLVNSLYLEDRVINLPSTPNFRND